MAKHRTYYTLAERIAGLWCIQFGDYDKDTVQAELDDYVDSGNSKRKHLRIVTSAGTQAAIIAAINKLNAEEYSSLQ
jgi:hypothetical protein